MGYEGVGSEEAVVVGDNAGVCVSIAVKAATKERRKKKNVLEGWRIIMMGDGFRQIFWRWSGY